MDLGGVGDGLVLVGGDLLADGDRGGQGGLEEMDHLGDDHPEADALALGRGLAAEGEDLPHDLLGAVEGAHHLVQVRAGGRAPRQVVLGQFDVAHDAAEDVVEIVGDAAGEGSDGFHLLQLEQLLFQPRRLRLGPLARR